jgi:hypothetical protein
VDTLIGELDADDSFADKYFQEGVKDGFKQRNSESQIDNPYKGFPTAARWWRRGYNSTRRLYWAVNAQGKAEMLEFAISELYEQVVKSDRLFRIHYAGFPGLNEFSRLPTLSYSPQTFAIFL